MVVLEEQMPSHFEKARSLMATALMLEVVTYKKEKDWFELFRKGEMDEDDLELTLLVMIQLEQLPCAEEIKQKTPQQKQRLKARLRSVDYALGVKVIRMWHSLNLSQKHLHHRIKYYLANVGA